MKKVYPQLIDPEDYPEFRSRWAKAVTRSALNNTIQFTTLRHFTVEDGKITDIEEKLNLYGCKFFQLTHNYLLYKEIGI